MDYAIRQERQAHVLIVCDDPATRGQLADCLGKESQFRLTTAEPEKALNTAFFDQPDIVVFDTKLPGKIGFKLARDFRNHSQAGIILITEQHGDPDCVLGLEAGADDYIARPFEPRELRARVVSLLRRVVPVNGAQVPTNLKFNGWCLNTRTRCMLAPDGDQIVLSSGECKLLTAFLTKPNHVFTRAELQRIAGREHHHHSRSVDVLIGRLRQKLREDPVHYKVIITIHGEGYLCIATPS